MKRRTQNNVLKATEMIFAKGYDWYEANSMALQAFDNAEGSQMPVEWFIDKIITKEEWLSEYGM